MTNVQLAIVSVESQRRGLRADVRASLGLCSHTAPTNATVFSIDDILRQRNGGHQVWIVPAPACRLRVSIHLLGRISGQCLEKQAMVNCIEGCDVRESIRLQSNRCFRFSPAANKIIDMESIETTSSIL